MSCVSSDNMSELTQGVEKINTISYSRIKNRPFILIEKHSKLVRQMTIEQRNYRPNVYLVETTIILHIAEIVVYNLYP